MSHTLDLQSPHSIYRWAQEKRGEIEQAFSMKGGWEGWLQVELGLRLQREGIRVEREQHVFSDSSKKATDMVFTTLSTRLGEPPVRTIVELKCESLLQDCRLDGQGRPVAQLVEGTSKPFFARRIEADLNKIGVSGENLRNEYQGCHFLIIGFSISQQARDYLLQHTPSRDPNRPKYFLAISSDELNRSSAQIGFQRAPGTIPNPNTNDTLMMWCYLGRKA